MRSEPGSILLGALRAVTIGLVLGFINVAVVGCTVFSRLESSENNPDGQSAALPASLLTGMALGLLAQLLRRVPRAVRRVVLSFLAIGVVYALAEHFAMQQYADAACIPTVVAALLLEHWTRERVASSALPEARAR